MPSIGIGQVLASFKINCISVGLASKKWYWCITTFNTYKWLSYIFHTYLGNQLQKTIIGVAALLINSAHSSTVAG